MFHTGFPTAIGASIVSIIATRQVAAAAGSLRRGKATLAPPHPPIDRGHIRETIPCCSRTRPRSTPCIPVVPRSRRHQPQGAALFLCSRSQHRGNNRATPCEAGCGSAARARVTSRLSLRRATRKRCRGHCLCVRHVHSQDRSGLQGDGTHYGRR
jgi:hypothetical protein